MNNNIGIIITARVNSYRLERKVLQEINGKKTIEILLDHLLVSDDYPIILAIPQSSENDILEKIAENKGVEVYRGEDNSPMHRLYQIAIQKKFDHIVRITADDILIDYTLLKKQIDFHIRGKQDYTFMRRCPEGIAGEVIKFSALEKGLLQAEKLGFKDIEFVSYYVKLPGMKIKEFYPPFEYQYSFRLTLDYPEDLLLLRIIFSALKEPFGTLDIINFLKKNKYLLNINKLPKVSFFTCNYNQSEFVIDAIKSVVNQDFNDWEYIIIDDCSDDNSVIKILEYLSDLEERDYEKRKRIKFLRNKENIGLTASSNKALKFVQGKYIMRVDADDILKKNGVKKMVEYIELENLDGVITAYNIINKEGKKLKEIHQNTWHPGCALLNKRIVNEVKYKENVKYLDGIYFYNQFTKVGKIGYLDEVCWNYRRHEKQKTAQKERLKEKKKINTAIINKEIVKSHFTTTIVEV